VSSYVHRNVIELRIKRGEYIETIQKYDPDKLDHYRYDLSSQSYLTAPITTVPSSSSQVLSDSVNLRNREEIKMDRKYPIID
jgi:hypothetical protein